MPKKPAIRVLIHAGFHKTGTSGLQKALRQNAPRLAPDCQVFLKPEMRALCEATRGYSVSRSALDLGLIQYEAALFADSLRAPVNILSSEDLCGHMPGRLGIDGYHATPEILLALCAAFHEVNKDAQITVFLTSRNATDWINSSFAQNTRASRQTLTREAYVTRFAQAADLPQAVANITQTLAPIPVHHVQADDVWDQPLGLLTPLMDLVGIPTTGLIAPKGDNPSLPEETLHQMLRLNQSDLDDAALRDAKRRLL